jgi:hypothetical protein
MSTDNLMESVFERVLEEKRNNTPINEDNNLLSKSLDVNDIELSAVEDPGCEQSTNPPTDDVEKTIVQAEEMIREEPAAEKAQKSKYVILCASLSKLICLHRKIN